MERHLTREEEKIPVLTVEVIPGIESKMEDLGFVWNVTQQETFSLNVQLFFTNAIAVSSNVIPDTVKIQFNDPFMFMGHNGLTME